jgi:hypothetical protein
MEWLPVPRFGRRLTRLDPEHQARYLTWLESQPVPLLRAGFWGVRTLALLGYYGRPTAVHALGYAPDARGWEGLAETP